MSDTVDHRRIAERTDSASLLARKIESLAQLVRDSSYTVFFTGAGVSTSSGIADYRGPKGAWTLSRIEELAAAERAGTLGRRQADELATLRREAARTPTKSARAVDLHDAEPNETHMAMATLVRLGYARYVVTTNLDGVFRKAGLRGHAELCCLHGDVYVERCTACGYDFERNYHVRREGLHPHDHSAGLCPRCGSAPPEGYAGRPTSRRTGAGATYASCGLVGTRDADAGTKDTHVNFGELLDAVDLDEAERHCARAELCVVAGTSMTLRHITHMPFLARRTAIVNLQATPDDARADLRIWAPCDAVFRALLARLGVDADPVPAWHPRDAVPVDAIPRYVSAAHVDCARRLAQRAVRLGGLLVGNATEAVDDERWRWTVFVRPAPAVASVDLGAVVASVTFGLHPTFKVLRPPFEVTRVGAAAFNVEIAVAWRCADWGESTTYVHKLCVDSPQCARVYAVDERQ
eukprot:m51a1_g8053 putative transcriptional sir2 family protein (465) ;mRNA; f:118182-119805